MSDPETKLKVDDIKAVTEKLEALGNELPPGQREVLGWILARAEEEAPEADVSGYAFLSASPVGTSVVRTFGVRAGSVASGDLTIKGGWSW